MTNNNFSVGLMDKTTGIDGTQFGTVRRKSDSISGLHSL